MLEVVGNHLITMYINVIDMKNVSEGRLDWVVKYHVCYDPSNVKAGLCDTCYVMCGIVLQKELSLSLSLLSFHTRSQVWNHQ